MTGNVTRVLCLLIVWLLITQSFCNSSTVKHVPLNISFTHGIGLGESLSKGKKVQSSLMINMLTGRVDYLNGFVVGGIFNQIREEATGVLVGGICNVTGGDHRGIAVAGISNVSKEANGLQIAGIATVHAHADFGIHIAGISAITHGQFKGIQLSGINSVTQDCQGVQISGFLNRARISQGLQLGGFTSISQQSRGIQLAGGTAVSKEVKGAQISTIGSISKEIQGFSLSGISCVTGDLRGVQVSLLANVAQEVKGVQLGVVNVAGKNSGYPIGLVSIDKSYKPGVVSWVDDQLFINTGIESGSHQLYNIFFFGFRPHERGAHSLGVALGHSFAFTERLKLNLDVTAELIRVAAHPNSSDYWENFQNKVRLMAQCAVVKKFSLYGGISFNTSVSEEPEGLYFLNDRALKFTAHNSNDNLITFAPGFMFGVSFR